MNDRAASYWSSDEVVARVLCAQRDHMWSADHFARIIAPAIGLGSGPRILDVGCGPGLLSRLAVTVIAQPTTVTIAVTP